MRRSALAALLLPGLALLASCSGRETSQPVEPSFAKVDGTCLSPNQLNLYHLINAGIDSLFVDRNAQKAAHEHLDNIVSDLCPSPDYDAARQHLNSFVQQIAGQPEDQLEGEAPAWTDLVNWAIVLANDPSVFLNKLDPGVFTVSGALGVVDPSLGELSLVTKDDSVTVRIPGENGSAPFILAISREGKKLKIVSDHVDPFAQKPFVGVCVSTDDLNQWVADRLIIRHGSAEFLEPIEDNSVCPPPPQESLVRAPTSGTSWLGRVASWADNAARSLFGPEPVRAMYFAGRGLGGLTGSFSPFDVLDPYTISAITGPNQVTAGDAITDTVEVTWPAEALDATPGSPEMGWTGQSGTGSVNVAGQGCELDKDADKLVCPVTVTGMTPGNATVTAEYPGLPAQPITITVLPRKYTLTNTLAVETPGILEITDNVLDNTCSADDKWADPLPCDPWTYSEGTTVTLTVVVHQKIVGSWYIEVTGDLTQDVYPVKPTDEPSTFEFPIIMNGDKDISFTLKH